MQLLDGATSMSLGNCAGQLNVKYLNADAVT